MATMPLLQLEVKPEMHALIAGALIECEREQSVRSRCYAKWVEQGKLTTYAAKDQFDRLAAAIQLLRLLDEAQVVFPPNVLDMPSAVTA